MLKIKDSVDLKELEKFGIFEVHDDVIEQYINLFEINSYEKDISDSSFLQIDGNTKEILVYINDNNYIQDTLYDLIKADLVEKVSDENE